MLRVMPQDWEPQDWAEQQASRVAREIIRLRDKRSAQWLSDETERLGYRVSRAVIADLENGRRKYVTTAELTVLAVALDTAPIALLFPPSYDEVIEILPGFPYAKLTAVEAFSGRYHYVNAYRMDVHALKDNLRPLQMARRIEAIKEQRRTLMIELEGFGEMNEAFARQVRAEIARLSEQLAELEASDDAG